MQSEGRVDGAIAFAPRGTKGFGYDPLFLPSEAPGKTLAELDSAEKNQLSHRGRALRKLRPALERLVRGDSP
jgi:XTP/dITP diphosphohydrolase